MTSKFERKWGKYAINNLPLYLIIGYVIGYVLFYANPILYSYLTFNPYAICHGQIWRVLTWIITIPESLGIFTIIMLFLYYSLGKSLERTWGAYKFNKYIGAGILFTVVGSMIVYLVLCLAYNVGIMEASKIGATIGTRVSTYYINMSIFLAFAATYPEMQLMLYFIIPVKVKWFGYIYGAFILIDIIAAFGYSVVNGVTVAALIISSLLNFLIYFISTKKQLGSINIKQKVKKTKYKQSVEKAQKQNFYEGGARHKCYVCGRTELDNPNLTFRYCSKCSGSKEYCEDHLFTHQHS